MIHQRVLKELLRDATLSTRHTVLAVCGGTFEREVFSAAGFTDVTISNLDEQFSGALAPYKWSLQDAENLTYPDNAFDVVFVHAGLHHCSSPHRALLEMYRVARRAIIVIEARDSISMRIARRLGFTTDYEIEAVSDHKFESGGVRNGPIPNFIYRWTENEALKTIKSFEPRYTPQVRFYYGLRLPYERFRSTSRGVLRTLLLILGPLAELFARVLPKQGNEFAFVILKRGKLQPWLCEAPDGQITVSREVVKAMGRIYKRPQGAAR
jgi:ubiquinone/menaquinone biosynthesis C-methylase UbiE